MSEKKQFGLICAGVCVLALIALLLIPSYAATSISVTTDAGENLMTDGRTLYPRETASSALLQSGSVNINTADKAELVALPGIGEKLALTIIEYRSKNGEFKEIESIMDVPGIGAGKFEKIKEFISVE